MLNNQIYSYKINQYFNINLIPILFLVLNLTISLYLINDNKKIKLVISRIPIDEFKKYQNFANDKRELEHLKWKEKSFINRINENEKQISVLKDKLLNLELEFKEKTEFKNISNSLLVNDKSEQNNIILNYDEDMVGLEYPEINFEDIKLELINGKLLHSLYKFFQQLQCKLIYLEKEINVTRLFSYYTSRTLYLEKKKIKYDDSNIAQFYQMISWLVIHKSTQLKGIASDKYLACKYAEMKLGENLCPHRIDVYDTIEEIDFEKLIKIGNVVLKVSNGCRDNIFIRNNSPNDIEKIKQELKFHFNRDYSLLYPEFFHLYAKKRIVLERIFEPISDLFEFKYSFINREIKLISVRAFVNNDLLFFHYNPDYTPTKDKRVKGFDILQFDKEILGKLRNYAIKLSEDFPNFIRVDLYVFQNKIYLSELTFDHMNGVPDNTFEKNSAIREAVKNWKRI